MKTKAFAFALLLGVASSVQSQAPYKVYTSPKLPMRDALQRMNLVAAWNTRVEVDGNRDGVFSVQVLPGKTNQLVVQTFKGSVYLFDADTGDRIWRTSVGVPYWNAQPVGYNSQSIFVTRRNMLFVLDRSNGSQRVYRYDAALKRAEFGYELNFNPNAAPVADEDFLYLTMGDRVNAILIPNFEAIERARRARDKLLKEGKLALPTDEDVPIPEGADSPQPDFYWGYRFGDSFVTTPPLFFGEQVSLLTTEGSLTSLGRFERGPREELFDFKVIGKTPGTAGQYHNMAYVGSDDFNLYAINMNNGRLAWRYAGAAPILRGPDVNDRDVFVAPERVGLRRVDRLSGREVWTNRDANRFLAANHAYVYALDHVGRFYVIDHRRGTTLATHDVADWAIAIANEWTDRIYLAANDGQVLCLRHRDLTQPLVMKSLLLPKKKIEKKEPPKQEEKKEEEKKDDQAGWHRPSPHHPDAAVHVVGRLKSRPELWRAAILSARQPWTVP